ncbi:MAG: RidA family protein [Candidatus Promineifilaceae bacterium]|jgi:2-iminobutanoate/2-iminopropanoate deaminase
MEKNVIHTEKAPAAVGPYSQAVRVGPFLYTAGQIGLDPQIGQMVADDIEVQTEQVLKNLTAVLQAAGGNLSDVVKTTVFLLDMKEFSAMNGVYASFFSDKPPARSAVQIAALPLGGRVEIEAVAYLPE